MPVLTCSRPSVAGIAVATLLAVAATAARAAPADAALLARGERGPAGGDRQPEGHGAHRVGQHQRRRPREDGRLRRGAPARRSARAPSGSRRRAARGRWSRAASPAAAPKAHADRPHGHGLPGRHARQRAVPPGRQQALRPRNRRRQGRHRRHPPFAGDPEGRRLARLRAAHGALQPRRGGRLDGSGETIASSPSSTTTCSRASRRPPRRSEKTEGLLLGAAGTARATLEVKGRSSHAGAAPELGRNALIELAYQLQQTRDIAEVHPGAQLNWTTAKAGVVSNQIPEKASAGGDVRSTAPGAAERLRAALQRQGQRRPPRPRHRDDRDGRGRPAAVPRQRPRRVRSRRRRRRSMPSSTAASSRCIR